MRTINRDSLFCSANWAPEWSCKIWYNIWHANIVLSDHHFPVEPHKWVNKYELCEWYKHFGEPSGDSSDTLCMYRLQLGFSLHSYISDWHYYNISLFSTLVCYGFSRGLPIIFSAGSFWFSCMVTSLCLCLANLKHQFSTVRVPKGLTRFSQNGYLKASTNIFLAWSYWESTFSASFENAWIWENGKHK